MKTIDHSGEGTESSSDLVGTSASPNVISIKRIQPDTLTHIFTKPMLPDLPPAAIEQRYHASGICSRRSLALMFGAGMPVGFLLSVVAIPIGLLVMLIISIAWGIWGGIVYFLGSLWTVLGGIFFLVTAIPVLLPLVLITIAYPLVYPAVVGYVIGQGTWLLAKKGNCRHPAWASVIGLVNAIAGYIILQLVTKTIFSEFFTVGSIANIIVWSLLETSSGWAYVILVVEGLIVALVAAATVNGEVSNNPFCESCIQWYGDKTESTFAIRAATPILQTITDPDVPDLDGFVQVSATTYPRLTLQLRKCPSCETADMHLAVILGWQEQKIKKDKAEIKDKSENWFTTMIPAAVGQKLEAILSKSD